MSAAQWRARDVSRRTALSQIQSAIVTYQGDYGKWPKQDDLSEWTGIHSIDEQLIQAWMSDIPSDPLKWQTFSWVTSNGEKISDFWYVIATRNGVQSGWFALMAKPEIAWSANRVICSNTGYITGGTDIIKDIHLCSSVEEVKDPNECSNPNSDTTTNECKWTLEQIRYVVVY